MEEVELIAEIKKVYILKLKLENVEMYLADLEGTLSHSKNDAVLFLTKERAHRNSGKLESFYEDMGVIATAKEEEINVREIIKQKYFSNIDQVILKL